MHSRIVLFVWMLACATLLSSCSDSPATLASSSGKTAEILFVIDKPIWNGSTGDSIRSIFRAEYPGLGQPEPLFSTAQIEQRSFTKMFESHRNIIIVEIKPEATKPLFELRKNVWAQPQLVFKLVAADEKSLLNHITINSKQIINYLYENERERMVRAFTRDNDVVASSELKAHMGFKIIIPKGYFIAKKDKDFCWIRRETEETSIGLLLYTYPYTDTLSFNETYILTLRDSLSKLHVPGPSEGSFMQVSRKVVMPQSVNTKFKDIYATEVRGLWEVQGDFMGGPFLSYTFVDEEKNRVVTLDGFVYAPRFDKRDYMIQVEALLNTYEK